MKLSYIYILLILISSTPTFADIDLTDPDVIAEGGRLYDNWWVELRLRKPQETHHSYPVSGKKSGANSWRCKECHGWDYKGALGAYGKGDHHTGITGINKAKDKNITQIVNILKDDIHSYDDVMFDYGLVRIASFVKYGQVDITPFLDKKTKRVNGNISTGKDIYTEACKECHGNDGREQNFKTRDNPEYIGTVATKNPWETIHKIRNGHPDAYIRGDRMPNMNAKLSLVDQINLLTYLQTLPVE